MNTPIKKNIIYIDMDGVIADFERAVIGLCEEPIPENKDEWSRMADEVCKSNPRIFHNLKPIDKAIDSVFKLTEHLDVYFLSTPMYDLPESYTGKRIWLEKHFGGFAKKRLILTHRKDLVIGKYLIDDTTKHGAGEFTGQHIHFGTDNFKDWDAVIKYIMKKETQFHDVVGFRDYGDYYKKENEFKLKFNEKFPNEIIEWDGYRSEYNVYISKNQTDLYFSWLINTENNKFSFEYHKLSHSDDGLSEMFIERYNVLAKHYKLK